MPYQTLKNNIMNRFQKNDWQYLIAFGAAVWFLSQIIFRY